jgi:hypothetical protein
LAQNLLANDDKERTKSATKGRKPGKGSQVAKKKAAYASDVDSEEEFRVSQSPEPS